jgi:hypothetical protein
MAEELLVFFDLLQNDPEITDIRWAAYMLATVHKETTFSFKASTKEDGRGGSSPYAQAAQVVDVLGVRGPENTVYSNTYYGRGYVQLTWEENYLTPCGNCGNLLLKIHPPTLAKMRWLKKPSRVGIAHHSSFKTPIHAIKVHQVEPGAQAEVTCSYS